MAFFYECVYQSSFLWATSELEGATALYKRYGFMLTEEKKSGAFGKPVAEQRYDFKINNQD